MARYTNRTDAASRAKAQRIDPIILIISRQLTSQGIKHHVTDHATGKSRFYIMLGDWGACRRPIYIDHFFDHISIEVVDKVVATFLLSDPQLLDKITKHVREIVQIDQPTPVE